MYKEINTGIFQVSINIHGKWWVERMASTWFKKLKFNSKSKYNSRKLYARAIDIFLHYYIYFPQRKNQSLFEYLLEYRETLLTGFEIYDKRTVSTKRFTFTTQFKVFAVPPYSIRTVNSYMTSIQWYLWYLKEQNISEIDSIFSKDTDWAYLKRKATYSPGGGYGLIMGPLLAQIIGPKKKLIRNLKQERNSSNINSYFPPELFLDLLEISKPRERAIYLLCGCAGTRIGQALSLTRDDYNYDSQEVYIINPLSDERGPSGITSRSLLLKNVYNIDMESSPYKYIACKYPIPLQYTELLWINSHFKKKFLSELSFVNKGNPVQNKHPFVFNTSSGKILLPNEVYRSFKRKIKTLTIKLNKEWIEKRHNIALIEKKHIDEEYEYLISQLRKVKGMHSLRHMYAIMWADFAASLNEVNIDDLQALCSFGLGHSSISSVMSYFTLRKRTRERIFNKINQTNDNQMTYIQRNITYLKKNGKGIRYER